jgi:hypothetical protein
MMRTLLRSVVAVSLVVAWAATTEACHKRRARAAVACVGAPQGYAAPASAQMGYYGSPQGYAAPAAYPGGGYPGGGYAAPAAYSDGGYPAGAYGGYPAGYDFGRPGYNPGGLGGPASGLGVRPGLGVGGFGPGR